MKEDIKKQLESKNKEIYLNKLNLDLDNNVEVLVLILNNLFINVKDNSVKVVLGLVEGFEQEELISNIIENFLSKYQKKIMSLINIKIENLRKSFTVDNILNEYRDNMVKENKKIKQEIIDYGKDEVIKLIGDLINISDNELYKKRIDKYFKNIFINSLCDKIIDVLVNRDIILINTFQESYLKYLDLNSKTIKFE